jgi:RNA polymerase sigma-70 factor (ECF subfamily)
VLVLKYLEHKDYQEMSDILRMPMGTVATLLNRAKKMMKEKITTLSPHLKNL